jgi:hypothetical protein
MGQPATPATDAAKKEIYFFTQEQNKKAEHLV